MISCPWFYNDPGTGLRYDCVLQFHAIDRYHHSGAYGFYETHLGAKHVSKTGKRK